MRVAVTGHMDLTSETTRLVRTAMRDLLTRCGKALTGISCLAPGADQIFAETVLALGGRLEAVIPSLDYADDLPDHAKATFELLLGQAETVHSLRYPVATPAVYKAANDTMLDLADALVAVWDGRPARGEGGTAEVVGDARRRAIRVEILWPNGSSRLGTPQKA
ncbi:hypothetical protein [Acrocarpospora catenulata]|uniref:hypothetical protein n=1 Tax=Acrocarpospora catenulata TaxID=2836182 RepID=UPI001BDA8962|nr:hypothetical protein [Acrocarpospora catenulata]